MYFLPEYLTIIEHFDPTQLYDARIFITGAGSWLGSWVTNFLDHAGIEYERFKKPYDKFPDGHFDYVLHLAQCDICPILDFSCQSKLLFMSSGSVYKPDPDVKSDKRLHEDMVISSGLDFRIARGYTFIGYGSPLRYAAARFIDRAMKGQPLQIFNDSIRTYLYMADVVAWLLTILVKGERTIYDVAGWRPIRILELAEMVNRVTGNTGIEMDDGTGDIRPIYVPNIERLTRSMLLGLNEWTSLETAIKRTVEYSE